jgi:outer membrane protein OmpA-like peptidoglycan-associated protein
VGDTKVKYSGRKQRNNQSAQDEEVRRELATMRKQLNMQMAIVPVIPIGTDKNKNETDKVKSDSTAIQDSALSPSIVFKEGTDSSRQQLLLYADTVVMKDTVYISTPNKEIINSFTPIYFETGATTLSQSSIAYLRLVAQQLIARQATVELTGRTDASGSIAVNNKIARQRVNNVRQELLKWGVPAPQILTAIATSITTQKSNDVQRRVDMVVVQQPGN